MVDGADMGGLSVEEVINNRIQQKETSYKGY